MQQLVASQDGALRFQQLDFKLYVQYRYFRKIKKNKKIGKEDPLDVK